MQEYSIKLGRQMMTYTIFNSLHNPQGQQFTAQWADICRMLQNATTYPDKASQPLIKLGTFENASRGAGHSLTHLLIHKSPS